MSGVSVVIAVPDFATAGGGVFGFTATGGGVGSARNIFQAKNPPAPKITTAASPRIAVRLLPFPRGLMAGAGASDATVSGGALGTGIGGAVTPVFGGAMTGNGGGAFGGDSLGFAPAIGGEPATSDASGGRKTGIAGGAAPAELALAGTGGATFGLSLNLPASAGAAAGGGSVAAVAAVGAAGIDGASGRRAAETTAGAGVGGGETASGAFGVGKIAGIKTAGAGAGPAGGVGGFSAEGAGASAPSRAFRRIFGGPPAVSGAGGGTDATGVSVAAGGGD